LSSPEHLEQQEVVRALLRNPLRHRQGADASVVDLARKHEPALHAWFEHHLGWPLLVDRDQVRLFKLPADPAFPADEVPTARQCSLYCLLLAVFEDCGSQTVISELVDKVTALTLTHPDLSRFDTGRFRERFDLVTAIRMLVEQRALTPTEAPAATTEHENAFIHGTGNAIYDLDHRTATMLLSCPVPPTIVSGPADLVSRTVTDPSQSTERVIHHALMRRLVDHPVVYIEDLSEEENAYLRRHRGSLIAALRAGVGVRVEVRADGLAVIDEELTDLDFPDTSTVPFAALLLADLLFWEVAEEVPRREVVPTSRALELAGTVAEKIGTLVKYIDGQPVDTARTFMAATRRLEEFGLIAVVPDGIRLRPALARYHDPSARGAHRSGEKLLLFGVASAPEPDDGNLS
jgi:uncharacterized protein (TIGR02678 family)